MHLSMMKHLLWSGGWWRPGRADNHYATSDVPPGRGHDFAGPGGTGRRAQHHNYNHARTYPELVSNLFVDMYIL